ncbi:unnamed protein product [Prunus armeniaca]|uniref:Myosin motor domain-containing protein n=1 Tax=Prunus armeniaca TaxID=36596 RepID=A0A6J5VT22_PRUAR|nr:unnamed protein product [Prunus armeniaca]CAB4321831.1 unnamed protein product [Prunus armeniaca]
METPAGGVDLTQLSYLLEPGVLCNLATRYENNEINAYTRNILIAINPFQSLSHLYDTVMMERMRSEALHKYPFPSLKKMMLSANLLIN